VSSSVLERTAGDAGGPPQVREMLADLHRLPAQRPAVLRVVQLADAPNCSLKALAGAAALDPAFAARLLELANSAYYGRSRRVTAIGPAVCVLGAEMVRGLAVTMALGLSGESGPLPPGFAERASTTAAACQLLAPSVGADPGDAFCAGLLRELGQALLYRADPVTYSAMLDQHDAQALPGAERAWCGLTSGEVGATVLRSAGVPEVLCDALAQHQRDDESGEVPTAPLPRALRAGVLVAEAVLRGGADDETVEALNALTGGGHDATTVGALALRTAAQAAALALALQ
jgi:HD-like signal output (HDOD) protein